MSSVSKLYQISSRSGIIDPSREIQRTASVKSTRPVGLRKSKNQLTTASTRAFITQDDQSHFFFDETAPAPPPEEPYENISLAYRSINDKRVKGVLGRLDSTIHKLNDAWKACHDTFNKTADTFNARPIRTAATTFALTEVGLDGTNASNSRFLNFLNMTPTEFLSPDMTAKMGKVAQSLDLDPRSNEIRDFLWNKINQGRDYYNVVKEEVRKKEEKLKHLHEQSQKLDVMADSLNLEAKVEKLEEDIVKAEQTVELTQMQTEALNGMIFVRKRDIDLYRKRFTLNVIAMVQEHKLLDKNVDYFITLDKVFQHYMQEMGGMKKASKKNRKLLGKIRRNQEVKRLKDEQFEGNLEIEKAYQKKKKAFIIKTKKELELEKQKEKEKVEQLEKDKLYGLYELKNEFEANFDLLSTVSKKYSDKEEYVAHLETLQRNNEELEVKVSYVTEEINLKKNIDLPTLQAELNELKVSRDPMLSFFEGSKLKRELFEKTKKNESIERNIVSKQKLLTNLTRGVMTVFNNVSIVKDYLNLEKLDEIKLRQDNLGDVLVFSGEVLEILNKNHDESPGVRSHPVSARSLSDDE